MNFSLMKMNPRAISYVNTIVSEKIPHESSVCVCAAPGSRGQSLRLVASLPSAHGCGAVGKLLTASSHCIFFLA